MAEGDDLKKAVFEEDRIREIEEDRSSVIVISDEEENENNNGLDSSLSSTDSPVKKRWR